MGIHGKETIKGNNMNESKYPKYMFNMYNKIDEIAPGASTKINQIPSLPADLGIEILSIVLSFACQGTNEAVILLARKEFKEIPPEWTIENLDSAVRIGIDMDDEWDYLRLLELLYESRTIYKNTLNRYIEIGSRSLNKEIQEAAEDFQKILKDEKS